MTKLSLVARISLNIIGVYFIVCWLDSVSLIFGYFSSTAYVPAYTYKIIFILLVIHILVLLVPYYIFIRKGASIWAIPANTVETQITQLWIQAVLRLAFVFCGVMILIYNFSFNEETIFFLITSPRKIVDMIVMGYIDPMFKRTSGLYISIIINVIKVILGVYLLLGAQRIVKWQTKKLIDESVPIKIPDTSES